MTYQKALDPEKIWLHTEIINGRLHVVSQDGRIVGGVVSTQVNAITNEAIATITMNVEIAAKLDGDNIGFVV